MNMKKFIYTLAVMVIISSSTVYAYGILTNQWDDGYYRYCKYSDGKVVKIDFTSVCEQTNE
mgnify:CR=1 FL=1